MKQTVPTGKSTVFPPQVADAFYPGHPAKLSQMIDAQLHEAQGRITPKKGSLRAMIVPHAGYPYSGPIAATGYATLAAHQQDAHASYEQVLILAPAHRMAVSGLATVSYEAFETPLGQVRVDQAAIESLCAYPFVHAVDQAYEREHAVEVQLPFLQTVLSSPWRVIPMLIGDVSAEQVAKVIEAILDRANTLVLISSDLSHFHAYDEAKQIDEQTVQMILEPADTRLLADHACGCAAINAVSLLAHKRAMRVQALDVRNSGDTAGPKDRVVGYGAFAYWEDVHSVK